MAQKLIQTQEQKQVQVQRLTQQQMMLVKMLEMPLTELEQSVSAELDDNPALESCDPDKMDDANGMMDMHDGAEALAEEADGDDYDKAQEREERKDALDDALAGIGMDDQMPETPLAEWGSKQTADYEEMTYGDRTSFYDKLKEQMLEVELTEQEKDIMEYVIGSLDADGLLRKDMDTLCDELALYRNIFTTEEQIAKVVKILQTFDPPGIGAESLKECLLLQIARRKTSVLKEEMTAVMKRCFDDFMNKRWDRIADTLGMTDDTVQQVIAELLKLNPKPGAALGETDGMNLQQITPDFIVDTADDGTVTFSINGGHVPELFVSPSFNELIHAYAKSGAKMNRKDKEALLYAKEKVERAQCFIDAVKQRRHTLYVTMKAIIDIQRRYFQEGDEADLQPMILKDVADRTGLDISTVSRVSNQKYAQTRWGTFKLRHFFSDSVKTESGEELSTRKVKAALKDIIAHEDKKAPLSDDAIKDILQGKGFPVARRTVAKYREQLGLPVARLRKE